MHIAKIILYGCDAKYPCNFPYKIFIFKAYPDFAKGNSALKFGCKLSDFLFSAKSAGFDEKKNVGSVGLILLRRDM